MTQTRSAQLIILTIRRSSKTLCYAIRAAPVGFSEWKDRPGYNLWHKCKQTGFSRKRYNSFFVSLFIEVTLYSRSDKTVMVSIHCFGKNQKVRSESSHLNQSCLYLDILIIAWPAIFTNFLWVLFTGFILANKPFSQLTLWLIFAGNAPVLLITLSIDWNSNQ